ncbi:TetR/AcrR family transcriptional regulator [Bacillus sp. 31A1R]|uniref:TetR/AcrR family transcriptional regulator n=1 Tax=Robertmurraya mangrovi TaxID=3098077 RepID=A0ABU5IWL6_9BACI|nr:TetR/AcrR family transcriptional regulator [Bacillus sp. 31A1R]MDZ5471525.1 TetR/AcrR family transcriptional regulator [Bacillus sp. 31A1R]
MSFAKNEHKQEQRNKVLISALECFASKGYDAATMDDIVLHSSVSKGSIYKLFKSKEEIYIELMYKYTDEFFEEINLILAKYTTAREKLSSLFIEYLNGQFDSYKLNSFLVHFELQLYSTRKEQMLKLLEERRLKRLGIISKVISEGIQNGELKQTHDADVYAEMFWAFFDGAIETKLVFPNFPYEKLVIEQRDVFIKNLANN